MKALSNWLGTHLSWLILASMGLAIVFPGPGDTLNSYSVWLLMMLMYLGSLSINLSQVVKLLRNWPLVLIALMIIHLLTPCLAWVFRGVLTEAQFLGLVLAGAITPGMSVLFLTNVYKGNPSLSLLITTVSHGLSPIILPLVVFLFARTSIQIDAVGMGITLLKLVVIPLVLATLTRKTFWAKLLSKMSTPISVVILMLLIYAVMAPISHLYFDDYLQTIKVGLITALMISINFFAGFGLGDTKTNRITLSIVSSFKNFTLAMVVATSLFTPDVAIIPAIYTMVNILMVTLMKYWFNRTNK